MTTSPLTAIPLTLPQPAEQYPALAAVPGLVHAFTLRQPGLEVSVDREAALERLAEGHAAIRTALGLDRRVLRTARQVHGAAVARVSTEQADFVPEADALITDDARVCLGIYVADCCAVYLVDPVRGAIGLAHSGRKGSELGIAGATVRRMVEEFGCEPARMIVQLGPCIRPPHYEIDFAPLIVASAREAGVGEVRDCGLCTACYPERYYSYRQEKGKTGRMLALLALPERAAG